MSDTSISGEWTTSDTHLTFQFALTQLNTIFFSTEFIEQWTKHVEKTHDFFLFLNIQRTYSFKKNK